MWAQEQEYNKANTGEGYNKADTSQENKTTAGTEDQQHYSQANDKTTFMNTLTSCVNKVVKDGYTDSFQVKKNCLYSAAKNANYKPEEVKVINFYRFEGESDPGDMVIMYVIETSDGSKGTLIDAFGTYSDGSVSNFMKMVEDVHKKV